MLKTLYKIFHFHRSQARKQASPEIAFAMECGLFDHEYYAGVAGLDMKLGLQVAADHFFDNGWRQGLDPCAAFNTRFYLDNNLDVASSQSNPLIHYIRHGEKEGRRPNPRFDPRIYAREQGFEPGRGLALAHFLSRKQAPSAANVTFSPEDSDAYLVHNSGLFDAEFYLLQNPDLADRIDDAFIHFMLHGWGEGRDPNPYFDTKFYIKGNDDVRLDSFNPLAHYVRHGDREGRKPSHLFNPEWYRQHTDVADHYATALSHYLAEGRLRQASPRPHFDCVYYLRNYPDVAEAGLDPVLHYFRTGYLENRNPGPDFDAVFYRRAYLNNQNVNPLVHFDEHGEAAGCLKREDGAGPATIASEVRRFSNQGPQFEAFDPIASPPSDPLAKGIAFYLPQFHRVRENDVWWGTGFTEWRNVARGLPRFAGHYQPRIPRDLGFYDLTHDGVMQRQIELAKAAGLSGFCYYHYWFDGKRLLEKPVNLFLDDPSLNFPFCLMWANENWTRRWDGLEQEVLFEQTYREEDDAAFIADLARHFRDARYIRIEGRPLFVIYRPRLIPDTKNTIERWRQGFKEQHGMVPLMFMAQGFGDTDPREFDLDGAIEFPPHKVAAGLPTINASLQFLDEAFAGNVISYTQMVERSRALVKPDFSLMRGTTPSWDNDARRQGQGNLYHGSTPHRYQRWLEDCIQFARNHPVHNESFVFINAWNEWAEGAYLEPDVYFGSAYLNANARAFYGVSGREKMRVLLVGHDAHPHGAQYLLLHVAETLSKSFGVEIAILLLEDGPLRSAYEKFGRTIVVNAADSGAVLENLQRLREEGFRLAFCNTIVTARIARQLAAAHFEFIQAIHELPLLIEKRGLEPLAQVATEHASKLVFAAQSVAHGFQKYAPALNPDKIVIRPQGTYKKWTSNPSASAEVRQTLGLDATDILVINVGYGDLRKGIDLFVSVAKRVRSTHTGIHFAWLGNIDQNARKWIVDNARERGQELPVHFLPHCEDPVSFYEAGDIFFLSSREDPFPTVVLEAFTAGLPVVAFDECGGFTDLVRRHGRLARPFSIDDAANSIIEEASLSDGCNKGAAHTRKDLVAHDFRFDDYCFDMLRLLRPKLPRISVIVPNFNYENHLPERINSIFTQSHPIFETIVLDDASSDQSMEMLRKIQSVTGYAFSLTQNEVNSGSGYIQWDRGAQLARGDYVWIAEADDLADPDFLQQCVNLAEKSGAAFVFCDSAQIDETGARLGSSYKFYFDSVAAGKFEQSFVCDGPEFVRNFLQVKNIILNVSGVLWRRDALIHALEKTRDLHTVYKVACDWLMYAEAALACGPAGFVARALNTHRRHSASVTHARNRQAHFNEITAVQDMISTRLISENLTPDVPTTDAVARYRQELRKQFGLDD